MNKTRLIDSVFLLLSCSSAFAQVERVWLSHRSNAPSKLVINWMTTVPGESVVRFGRTSKYGQDVRVKENTTIHHVEIPLVKLDGVYHYSVSTGSQSSENATFKAYPTDVLRRGLSSSSGTRS